MQPFLRRSTATQHRLVAVKVLNNFLKRSVACLNVEEVNRDQFDAEPTAIEDIVFPSKGVKGDRIDVLVEEDLVEKRSVRCFRDSAGLGRGDLRERRLKGEET